MYNFSMLRFFILIIFVFSMFGVNAHERLSLVSSAYAAESKAEDTAEDGEGGGPEAPKQLAVQVAVSAYERDNFTRIVFEPNIQVHVDKQEVAEEKGALLLTFARRAIADLEAVRRNGMKNIYDLQIMSPLTENLALKVVFPESSRYRFFRIQKRAILDVFTPKNEEELAPEIFEEKQVALDAEWDAMRKGFSLIDGEVVDEQDQTTPEDTVTEAPEDVVEEEEPSLSIPSEIVTNEKFEAATNLPVNNNIGNNVITLSSTEPFGLAVFERFGHIWLVSDQPNMRIPPVIEGPQKDIIGEPQRVEMGNGTAYRFNMPEDAYVQPQGGGFIWKIRISGRPFALPSATIRKNYDQEGNSSILMSLENSRELLRLTDPVIGDDLAVATVPVASLRLFRTASFVDLDILPAYVGAVMIPKADGMRIEATNNRIRISNRNGLNIGPGVLAYRAMTDTNDGSGSAAQTLAQSGVEQTKKGMFKFDQWAGPQEKSFSQMHKDRRLAIAMANDNQKRKLYLDTAEFLIAHALPYEASGYLDLVEDKIKKTGLDTRQLPEYRALRAIAHVGARQYKDALKDLDIPTLQEIDEMKFWKALALAGTEDYQRAFDTLPVDLNFLKSYPDVFRHKLLFDLAELALQADQMDFLEVILNQIQLDQESLSDAQKAGLSFYRGVLAKANGLPGDVQVFLTRAADSDDLLYSTRAGYALVMEGLRNDEMSASEAINRLERLRFAWRGGDLEANINKALGQAYIDDGQEQKGLNILRGASRLMDNRAARQELSDTMVEAFKRIFTDPDKIEQLKPLQALAVYEEFKELLPTGHDGDVIIMAIVDKLSSVELFSRAISLMSGHMERRLSNAKKSLWSLKLAAIQLRDRQPEAALNTLATVPEGRFRSDEETSTRYDVLRAKALASLDRIGEALTILNTLPQDDPFVLQLKADTAWRAGVWDVAAEALNAIIERQDITSSSTLTTEQAQMILNMAIAYNLSSNTQNLQRVRQDYTAAMRSSPLSKSFQVVTRPMREAVLADRQTIMSHVFEADMFGDSLNSLSNMDVNTPSDG